MYVQERKLIVIVSTLMTGKENGREKFCKHMSANRGGGALLFSEVFCLYHIRWKK